MDAVIDIDIDMDMDIDTDVDVDCLSQLPQCVFKAVFDMHWYTAWGTKAPGRCAWRVRVVLLQDLPCILCYHNRLSQGQNSP